MSAIANIAVPDAESTPVTHTFAPRRIDGDTGKWQNRAPASPIGYENLSATLRPPVANGNTYKQTVQLDVPKLKTYTDPSGNVVTTVDYVHRVEVSFMLPAAGLLQERKNLRKLLLGILADSQIIDQIENLGNSF